MTPGNAAGQPAQRAGLTPENAELVARYAGHLERSPLAGHSLRTYLGAIRAYLAWLEQTSGRRRPAGRRQGEGPGRPGLPLLPGGAARCADTGHYPILKRRQAVTNRC